jgi:nitrite reductase (NADH) large subunit
LGTDAQFGQKSLSTKLKVTGCDLFSAGDFSDGKGREDIVFRNPSRGVYKRLVIENNVVVGAVFYGDTADSNRFFDLIRDQTDILEMRETLIICPNMQGGRQRTRSKPLQPCWLTQKSVVATACVKVRL